MPPKMPTPLQTESAPQHTAASTNGTKPAVAPQDSDRRAPSRQRGNTRPQQPEVRGNPKMAMLLKRVIGPGIVTAYLAATFALTHVNLSGTLLDHTNYPTEFQIVDKIYHFVAYMTLTFLVLFFLTDPVKGKSKRVRADSARQLAIWCCFLVLYSIFDEVSQPWFGRRLEALDLLANVVGISFAQGFFVFTEATGFRHKLWNMK